MQNSLTFYPGYDPYPINEDFLASGPDLSVESDVFSSSASTTTTAAATTTSSSSMHMLSPANLSVGVSNPKKRKPTSDTEPSYSPASIYSDNSNYSEASYPSYGRGSIDMTQGFSSISNRATTLTGTNNTTMPSNLGTSAEEGSSDDNDDDGDEQSTLARKREKHTQVEAQRRALEKAHFRELSSLITNRNEPKSSKLHHLDLLKIAADQITEMNLRHKHDPLRPSNLTDNELNFLTIEASNSFLFVTTMEPSVFRIIHLTDSIQRILNTNVDQWRGQDFFSFVHRDDLIRVKNQLMSLNPSIGIKIHLECRLKQGQSDRYSSVMIDGMTKKLDQSLRPVQNNAPGYLAFVGICHVPLITKYSETNMSLYRNNQVITFRCRCSPHDWKIFLVDRSISTLHSVSYDLFRQKSILDFIHASDQNHLLQVLLRSTSMNVNETISCHFIDPALQTIIPMSVEIKSFFNPTLHRADFIELTFKNVSPPIETKLDTSLIEFFDDTKEIDRLLESESNQNQMHHNSTTQNVPFYYSNDWVPKNELY